jgi:hypothetical protein
MVRVRAGREDPTFPSAHYRVIIVSMAKQETLLSRKRRGPKPTGKGHLIGVRLLPEPLAALDDWISRQPDHPSRPEAVRRILDKGLGRAGGKPRAINHLGKDPVGW